MKQSRRMKIILSSLPMNRTRCQSALIHNRSIWREQFLVPPPPFHPVFTIVIYGC